MKEGREGGGREIEREGGTKEEGRGMVRRKLQKNQRHR